MDINAVISEVGDFAKGELTTPVDIVDCEEFLAEDAIYTDAREEHGDEFCQAILDGETDRNDVPSYL